MKTLAKLIRDERGTAAVEYGLILAMVFLAVAGAIGGVGSSTVTSFNTTATKVSAAG